MFEKALLCTDLSDASYRLVGCTGQLKALGIREVVVAHAIDVSSDGTASADFDDTAFEQQCGILESLGMRVHVDTPVGFPSFSLAEVARRHDTKITLLASTGKGMFDAPFSGSVSSDVVLLSDSPVLLNGTHTLGDENACSLVCSRLTRDVLYATDFSDAAKRAFRVLEHLAERGTDRITLLHVQDVERLEDEGRSGSLDALDRTDAERLDVLRRRLESRGATDVRTSLVHGSPADRLAQIAESREHTLIVLGGHGRTNERGMLGSVSDRMVRHDSAPVLLVP